MIAEGSGLGVEGCWIEFFKGILGNVPQKTYFEDGFKDWVEENAGFTISYYDGMAYIVEC